MNTVLLRESFEYVVLVLPDTLRKIACYTDVQRTVLPALDTPLGWTTIKSACCTCSQQDTMRSTSIRSIGVGDRTGLEPRISWIWLTCSGEVGDGHVIYSVRDRRGQNEGPHVERSEQHL